MNKQTEIYDLIIRGGLVIDGSGEGGRAADVAVKAGRIAAIGALEGAAAVEIDASGKVVTPGFIDIHSHCDQRIEEVPGADNYLLQGVTTFLGGNCGDCSASAGIKEHFDRLKGRLGVNYALLAGFGDLRRAAMADPTAPVPTKKELKKMKDLLEKAMQDGAFGFSSGLEYVPDRFALPEEIEALATVAASYGGFYATHIRDEQTGVLTAMGEAISVAANTGVSLEISHLKACGAEVWGYGKTMVAMITEARALGVNVHGDMYPYGASNTGFGQAFPNWALEGGHQALKERLENPASRHRIIAYGKNQLKTRIGGDPSLIQISNYPPHKEWNGRRLSEILAERGKELNLDNLMELVIEMYLADKNTSIIYHYLDDADMKALMRSPYVSMISDGKVVKFGAGTPHPRSYGSFPRVLARYVGQEYVLSPEEAIRKMTSLPASKMGLTDRGLLKEGYAADIVIYDEEKIMDKADYLNAHQYPEGIDYVIINGVIAAEHGKVVCGRAGQIVYGPGYGQDKPFIKPRPLVKKTKQ